MSRWSALHHCDLYPVTSLLSPSSILPLLPLIFLLSPFSLLSPTLLPLVLLERNLKLFVALVPALAFQLLLRQRTLTQSADCHISSIFQLGEDSLPCPLFWIAFLPYSSTVILINLQPVYHALIIPVYICKAMVVAHLISYPHHLQSLHRYVGIFGNADPLDIAQWFSVATSVPTPTRRFDPRTGVCSNMFTGEPIHPRTSLHRIQQRISLLSFDSTFLPYTSLRFFLFCFTWSLLFWPLPTHLF